MSRAESFMKSTKCKHGHRSTMSNSAWCDLNKNYTVLKLHDMCHNPKGNYQMQITFTPIQFQLGVGSNKIKLQNLIKGTQTAWNSFMKTGFKMATPLISVDVTAKTKNPQSAQITSKILKTLRSGKILSLTDMHGRRLR